MRVLVSTDTSCLINYKVLESYPIKIFPLNVIIDGKEYLDGVDVDQEFLFKAMKKNKSVKTSTPPLGTVIEYFEKLFAEGYDQIIHFTISSKLSSMYDLFRNVSENYFESKIKVIDAYSVSSIMLSHVLFAYDEVQKGTDVETICELVEARKSEYYVCFMPENLNALKNGGRISPAIAAVGNALKLKPVILLKDGELVKDSMARSVKRTFIDKINLVKETYPLEKYDYSLISFFAEENVFNNIKAHLNETFKDYNVIEGVFPINVCAHCGPGTVGLMISPKINGKSINDFVVNSEGE